MIQSPLNNVIVKVTTKYIRNFTSILKMAAIQQGSSVEMADCVNIMGEVVSTPKAINGTQREYNGFTDSDIQVGDIAIFSHNVIFEFENSAPEEEPVFKNEFWYKGQSYFTADITRIFAVVRDGKIRMQNGYVMLEELEKSPLIILSQATKKSISSAQGVVSHIGKNLTNAPRIEAEVGDTVYFNPNKVQHFQINGKPFGIINQQQILGHSIPSYGIL